MHDDMDVAFGSIKIKIRGGSAGHRGIASLIDQLSTDAFVRLRIGIGRPPAEMTGPDYVLETFSIQELNQVDCTHRNGVPVSGDAAHTGHCSRNEPLPYGSR